MYVPPYLLFPELVLAGLGIQRVYLGILWMIQVAVMAKRFSDESKASLRVEP